MAESATGGEPVEHAGVPLATLLQRLDALRRAGNRYNRLNTADMRLLWLLSDGRPRTFREISEQLGLEQSTVNRQVNGAARAGLLEFAEAQPARQVAATEEGGDAFAGEVDRILDGYRDALALMGRERSTMLVELLGEFIDSYDEVLRATAEP